jgi:alcohol dehydrogenase class IV
MLPRLAVVDPTLTYSMPPALTASTGLDALTQLMEAFLSSQSNPLTDGICHEGLRRAARSLQRCYEDGTDKAARTDMSLASLFGGLALANAKLGAIHGLAAPLGGLFRAPHGVICARLLPHVMETNVHALKTREPGGPALARYDEVARILTGRDTARAADGVAWMQDLCVALRIPPLSDSGLEEKDFPDVVAKAQKASSMKGNPIQLTDRELADILRKAL